MSFLKSTVLGSTLTILSVETDFANLKGGAMLKLISLIEESGSELLLISKSVISAASVVIVKRHTLLIN